MTPIYLVLHTAAFRGRNCDAQLIDSWHRDRGWSGIGYHYVILNDRHDCKADGTVESGRPPERSGAHARGINSQSLGICCVGHGDYDDFTSAQYASLYPLLAELMARYNIAVDRLIGHCEINQLIELGVVDKQYLTGKSCPGSKIDMDHIRQSVKQQLNKDVLDRMAADSDQTQLASEQNLRDAIEVLRQNRQRFSNAGDELDEFLFHPEVLEICAALKRD